MLLFSLLSITDRQNKTLFGDNTVHLIVSSQKILFKQYLLGLFPSFFFKKDQEIKDNFNYQSVNIM